jgi:hypothetical protein
MVTQIQPSAQSWLKTVNKEKILATQRIYIVGTPTGETRLVRASVKQQALSHVANSVFVVRVASQDELVQAISKGVTVENYKAPDQAELDLA